MPQLSDKAAAIITRHRASLPPGFYTFRVRNECCESCAGAGMPGMPQLSNQELLEQTIQSAGSSVSHGKVRRKKDPAMRRSGRGGLAELTRMR